MKTEIFQTLMTETEGILNFRPLSYVSSDNNDEKALTPEHFNLVRPHLALAPLTAKLKLFRKKNFDYTQTLMDHFRKVHQRQYTSDLISRAKWREKSKQLKAGDLDWILNEFTPRGIWLLGRITRCHSGAERLPRQFDIHTARGALTRPLVKFSRVIDEEELIDTRSAATKPIKFQTLLQLSPNDSPSHLPETSFSTINKLFNFLSLFERIVYFDKNSN